MHRSILCALAIIPLAMSSCASPSGECAADTDCSGGRVCVTEQCVFLIPEYDLSSSNNSSDLGSTASEDMNSDTPDQAPVMMDMSSVPAMDMNTSSQDMASDMGAPQDMSTAPLDMGMADMATPTAEPCPQLPRGAVRQRALPFTANGGPNETATTLEELLGPWPLEPRRERWVYRGRLRQNEIVSLPFVIPRGTPDSVGLNIAWEADPNSSRGTTVSVSKCIGGILESQAVPMRMGDPYTCHRAGGEFGGALRIGTDPMQANCLLQKGVTYYLNVMDYSETNGGVTCDTERCTWLMTPSDF